MPNTVSPTDAGATCVSDPESEFEKQGITFKIISEDMFPKVSRLIMMIMMMMKMMMMMMMMMMIVMILMIMIMMIVMIIMMMMMNLSQSRFSPGLSLLTIYQDTPLHLACYSGKEDAARLLMTAARGEPDLLTR